jgi:hypothetical protein
MLGSAKRNDPKYTAFRKDYNAGRNADSTGLDKRQQYSQGSAPKIGGKAPKASGLKAASKSQIKKAKSMVSKGTGSGASKQAKASRKRI